MSSELVGLVGLILAWASREVIPVYLKQRSKTPSSRPPPMKCADHSDLATKEDISRLEAQVKDLSASMSVVRDWMNQEIGRRSKDR